MSDQLERIELYLAGGMTADEQLQFEQDLQTDAKLQETFARIRMINDALNIAVADDLRSRLKEMEIKNAGGGLLNSGVKVRRLNYRMAAAAGILLLVCAGLWYLVGRGPSKLVQFSEQQYIAYDYTRMRGNYSHQSDFEFDMKGGHFDKEKAIQWFAGWVKKHADDDEARFILADVLTSMKKKEEAKQQFAVIMANHSVLWGEKAEWNYVLLSVNDTWDDLAKTTLQVMIADPSHSYHQQAITLSRLLEE